MSVATAKLDRLREKFETEISNSNDAVREEWAVHPLTRALLVYIALALETQKSTWAVGGYTGESQDETLQMNSAAIGKCDALVEMDEIVRVIGGKKEDD